MKKIIYSFVIMIAAGSLFTSCVENTEPQGIRDIRQAKADYIESLSKLKEADARFRDAETALKNAEVATEQAKAALWQAIATAKEIKNQVAEEKALADIDSIRNAAAKAAVEAEEALAKAQAQLDTTLRRIVAESIGLNDVEKQAIVEKTVAYNLAYGHYNWVLNDYNAWEELLWNVEYDVVAGKVGYETADSYRDSIADIQAQIADKQAEIAGYEALKKEPAGVKDTLDALADEIAVLDAEITAKGDAKTLYEASVPFVDAKKEFKERVKTFKEDSLSGAEFKFVDVDEDDKDVPVKYELTDGLGIDQRFGSLINSNWSEENHEYNSYNQRSQPVNYKSTHPWDCGILYNTFNYGNKTIEVGLVRDKELVYDQEGDYYYYQWLNAYSPATPEQLTEGLDVLDKIVETLNRDLVVIDNIKDSTTVEEAKKAAEKAWKAYTTDRDTLEGGLKDYKPYKDSLAQIAKLAEDTVKAKKAHDDAAAELETVNAENTRKEADQIEAVKTTAAAYESAVKKLAAEIATYGNLKAAKTADSTKFIAAINAFGEEQAAFLGHQDSVKYNKGFDPETGAAVEHTDPISKLSIDYFRPDKKGDIVYKFGFAKVVEKICKDKKTGESVWTLTEKELLAAVENPLPKKGEGKTAADSIKAVEKNPAVAAAIKAFKDYQAVVKKAEHDADSTADDFVDAKTKFEGYHGEDDAIAAYKEVYKRFWGANDWKDFEKDTAATKFTWTDKTFLEPTNCVEFTYNLDADGKYYDPSIIDNSALTLILESVTPDEEPGCTRYNSNYNAIFKYGYDYFGTLTEFAKAILASQIVEDLGEYVPNKARLEKINAQVAKIREDVKAAIAEYEAATEGLDEVKARFYGVDEDGNILSPASEKLEEVNVDLAEGKWAFGGYLLEWAKELAPEYPEIVYNAEKAVKPLRHRKANLANYKRTLDQVYTAWWNEFEKEGKWNQRNVDAIVRFLDKQIKNCEDRIIELQGEIAEYEKAVAACEAGYSPAEVKVNALKAILAQKEILLEQAAEALVRAKAEYDAVIAIYGVNE